MRGEYFTSEDVSIRDLWIGHLKRPFRYGCNSVTAVSYIGCLTIVLMLIEADV